MKKIKFMPVLALVLCLFSGQVILAEDLVGTTEEVEAPVLEVTPDTTEGTDTVAAQSEVRYITLDSNSIQISTKFVHGNESFTLSFKLQDNSYVFDGESVVVLKLGDGTQEAMFSYFPVYYNGETETYTGTRSLGIWAGQDGDVSVSSISLSSKSGDNYTIANGGPGYYPDITFQNLSGFNFYYINSMYPFSDIPAGSWYQGAVDYVYYYKIMTGMNETTFAPASILSRAQFATILYRMEGSPEIAYNTKFKDVSEGQFYTKPVLWANSVGIITGYENGKFGPADVITREQMATMMYRYAQYKGYNVSNQADISAFPDNQMVSGFAKTAISWTNAEGIITGDQGKINPQGNASRAVSATIVMRFLNASL